MALVPCPTDSPVTASKGIDAGKAALLLLTKHRTRTGSTEPGRSGFTLG